MTVVVVGAGPAGSAAAIAACRAGARVVLLDRLGAGPAGSAAAIAACRAGARVVLLDRADFPRDKVCGDGIAADALDVLAGLGVTGITDGYPPVERLRLVAPGGAFVSRPLPRVAHTIPREVFDARLVTAAVAAGAELRRHTVRSMDDPVLAGAEVVIGADGAGSIVRRGLGFPGNPPGHLAIAIRGYAPSANTEQLIVTTRNRWPAYAWSFPVGDGTANVGYGEVLRGPALTKSFLVDRLLDLMPGPKPDHLRAHHLPLSTWRPEPGRGHHLLAGDALSLINPFTGEGIFYAVLSGALAGAAAATGPEQALTVYRRALRARLGRHLRHSGVTTRLSRAPRVVDAAVRAAGRDQLVFDRMMDLGVGDGVFDLRTIGRIAREFARSPSSGP